MFRPTGTSILGGLGFATPRFMAGGREGVAGVYQGGRGGSWTGREILLYPIIYRKYLR